MNTDTIVQFVCFTSPLEAEAFAELWKPFAGLLPDDREHLLLQDKGLEKKEGRHKYISRHMCSATDFRFVFVKGKSREHFPEHKASVKQIGGYLPVQFQSPPNGVRSGTRILVFVAHGERELDFYRSQAFHSLNIYEAYFENCAYSYIMEFFLPEQDAPALFDLLKERPGVEAAICVGCCFSGSPKKVSGSLL